MAILARARVVAIACFLFCVAITAVAQPVVDGTINNGEYSWTSGEWSMSSDETYLYVARANHGSTEVVALYLDVDPRSTPLAGDGANGSTVTASDPYPGAVGPYAALLPFRADVRVLLSPSMRTLLVRDGSNGWVAGNNDAITRAHGGTALEARIAWNELSGLGLSARPASFNWLAFELNEQGPSTQMTNPVPSANTANGARLEYVFAVANAAADNPFATRQSTWRVTDSADSGTYTLRNAVQNANADAESSRRFITFDLATPTIALTSSLPTINRTVTIDATTQTDWSITPVYLQGPGAHLAHDALWINASGCVVRGIGITGFNRAILVSAGSSSMTIAGNRLGIDVSGNAAPNGNGVRLVGATGTTIGGATPLDRNIISGNTTGIWIENSSGTTVINNFIGTGASGTAAVPNATGVNVFSSTGTTIGMLNAGNVISGNTGDGIHATSTDVTILGNMIGMAIGGTGALPNGGDGIDVGSGVTIGSTVAPNHIANQTRGIAAAVGDLVIVGNPLYGDAIEIIGGQPAPTVQFATIEDDALTIQFSLTSASTTATTQSMRLDLYGSATGAKVHRATSPCYSASTLTNAIWNVGAPYAHGESFALMATSYADANCSDPGDGASQPTASFTPTTRVGSTLSLSASTTSTTAGTNVTFTATVSSSDATNLAGTVSFFVDGAPSAACTSLPLNAATAQCTFAFGSLGEHQVYATYSGDGGREGNTSNNVDVSVAKAPTTLTLASSNPGGERLYTPATVAFTATISSNHAGATGTVTFRSFGSTIPACASVTVSAGQAQCALTLADFGTGTVSMTAEYSGDETHEGSTTPDSLPQDYETYTFSGTGNFSTATRWSRQLLPQAGKNVLINGTCTFDSDAANVVYAAMHFGLNASMKWPSNHARTLAVTNVTGDGNNVIDMTSGGTFAFSGSFEAADVAFTSGAGSVVMNGSGQSIPPLTFNNLTVSGVTSVGGTANVRNFFVAAGSTASLTAGTLVIRGSIGGGAGASLTLPNTTIPAGESVTWSMNMTMYGRLTVDGTLVPSNGTVVVNNTSGRMEGTGRVKVLAAAGYISQYVLPSGGNQLTVEYAGTSPQTINNSIYHSLDFNNPAGGTITGSATVTNVLTLTAGTIAPTSQLTVSSSSPSAVVSAGGWVVSPSGQFRRALAAGTNRYEFPIGTATAKLPMTIDVNGLSTQKTLSVSVSEDYVANDYAPTGVDYDRRVRPVWRVDWDNATMTTWGVTFDYSAADVLTAGATPAQFVVRRKNNQGSTFTTTGTANATTATATGLGTTLFDRFFIGNQLIDRYAVAAGASQSAGTPFNVDVTALDILGVLVPDSTRTVTMSGTGFTFDANGDGTFNDASKVLTNGTFTISAKATALGTSTITATDTHGKSGTSASIDVSTASTSTTLVSSANPSTGGSSVTFTATVTSPHSGTISGTVTFHNGQTVIGSASLSNGTAAVSTSSLAIGTHSITATYEGSATYASSVSSPLSQTVNTPPFGAPPAISATATSTSQISVSWIGVSGATSYEVFRATVNGGFALVATTGFTAIVDTVSANTTYLYRVRAVGSGTSPFSATDAATTVVFTDASLTGVAVKAQHLAELRTAVNAMRVAAGLGAGSFTESPSSGNAIKPLHITELRSALDAARAALGFSPMSYTDSSLAAGTKIKAAHCTELRAGTQ